MDSEPPQKEKEDYVLQTKASKKCSNSNIHRQLEAALPPYLKLRKIRVAGAPKMPLTGYVRYMNERRELLRKEYPDKNAMEHTKMIAEEWHQLAEERKVPYIKSAEIERQRYIAELHEFLRKHPEILAKEIAKDKERKNNLKTPSPKKNAINKMSSTPDSNCDSPPPPSFSIDGNSPYHMFQGSSRPVNDSPNSPGSNSSFSYNNGNILTFEQTPGEIPIFTNEFLEHNKICENEIRALRKTKADMELQCAVVEKNVENLRASVDKIAKENEKLITKTNLLEIYFQKLRTKLATAFSGLAIPTFPDGATMDNIEEYMKDLHKMATANTHGPACLNKAKDIIKNLFSPETKWDIPIRTRPQRLHQRFCFKQNYLPSNFKRFLKHCFCVRMDRRFQLKRHNFHSYFKKNVTKIKTTNNKTTKIKTRNNYSFF